MFFYHFFSSYDNILLNNINLKQIPLFYLTRSLKDTKAGTYLFYYSQFLGKLLSAQ